MAAAAAAAAAPTFESLQERLSALQETTTQARELIAQLEAYDPTYGNEDEVADGEGGGEGGENYASDLAAETAQLIDEQRDELEEIEEEMEDMRSGKGEEGQHERARLVEGARKVREGLRRDAYLAEVLRPLSAAASTTGGGGTPLQNSVSSLPPNANGTSPTTANTLLLNPTEARKALLGPTQTQTTRRKRSRSPSAARSSEAVTSSLLRMHASMASSLERSTFSQKMVDESSNSLKQLGEQYDSLDSLIQKSKGLLGVLVKSAKTDAWYLQTTVYMLLATLAWLVFRRWLYGPLWWLVWLPLRVLWGTGSAVVRSSASRPPAAQSEENAEDGVVKGGQKGSAADQVEGIHRIVPTVEVPQDQKDSTAEEVAVEGDESLVDKVGKIIDEASIQLPLDTELPEGASGWPTEEGVIGMGGQAARDEL
ncbi:hypothetical protein MKZ38_005638 [Zalerion maritima]|uniref:Sec20 C-terminal domain-containing protein n=1 Tax=Zalerion maritima TaxID=339359 RepID=A0AAD5WUQ3_9PEZI|nr:hypothetical protein MKZ38_005638 [Zalerion maritima]